MLSKTAIKYIQSLSFKKFRDENDVFIAEGPKVVNEIISSSNCKCKAIYAIDDYITEHAEFLTNHHINIIPVSDIELAKISTLIHPNKVLGLLYKKKVDIDFEVTDRITLMLDGISDPGNMGTIIRIADWFDLKNIICSEHCVDVYNTKVIQSSMASIARLNIIYTDLNQFISRHPGIPVYAATLDGDNLYKTEKKKPCFLIIGNESNGINNSLLDSTNKKISIPRIGHAESLNAAVATGIILSYFNN